MFCPICKAEYRPGFTRCSDCNADLVKSLAIATAPPANPEENLNAVMLWSGTDPQLFAAIRDALDWAKIFHFAQVGTGGALPSVNFPVYSVLVHEDDRNAAQAVLETVRPRVDTSELADDQDSDDHVSDTLDVEDEQDESAALAESDDGQPSPDDIAEDFHENEATAEVWSGDDSEMAETVRMCLRENGIGCIVNDSGGTRRVRVMPNSQTRAKEIIREILEGAPPQ